MNSNFLCSNGMNEEEFPPISATSPTYLKTQEFKSPIVNDACNLVQNTAPSEAYISPTNIRTTPPLNSSISPTEAFALQYQDYITFTPRNRPRSSYQARFLAVNAGQTSPPLAELENETDPSIISRREKQIEYGKITLAYERYCSQVPKEERTSRMPRTPDKTKKYSRRQFDGMVKIWKIKIHEWDLIANGNKFHREGELFFNPSSPENDLNNDNIFIGDESDESLNHVPPNVEKTPTEKAIEKSIMDWRDEYRVKEQVEEVPELSMVKKYKLGSPSNYSL